LKSIPGFRSSIAQAISRAIEHHPIKEAVMAARAKAKTPSKSKAKTKVNPIPAGFHTLTPYLVVRGAPAAIEFYKKALGAQARGIHYAPDGKVINAELKVGDSIFMLCDEYPEMGSVSPLGRGGTSVTVHIFCPNVDDVFSRAVAAGAKIKMPVMDMFWGDRYGSFEDPYGHVWSVGARKENLTAKEVEQRAAKVFADMARKQQGAG
jgi:PhnB protein